jgi:hypothetical protein
LFVQVPRSPVSICPTRATPTIRGGEEFIGFAFAAAIPEPAATATAAVMAVPSAAQ